MQDHRKLHVRGRACASVPESLQAPYGRHGPTYCSYLPQVLSAVGAEIRVRHALSLAPASSTQELHVMARQQALP